MTNLEKSAKKDTVGMIFTVVLYGVGAASMPYLWLANLFGGGVELTWFFAFIIKTLCAILPIYLIFQLGFSDLFRFQKSKIKRLILVVPAFLVMLNNIPFIPLKSGDMSINATFLQLLTYALFCLSIGIIEETVFRGVVLPLCLYKFSKDKNGIFWAIIVSSAIFGLVHLVNLIGGFNPAVFLQVGYSFLIGAICGFALVATQNIYVPILFHAVYDFGGFMLVEGIATGTLWTRENLIWTAVLSVVFAVVIIVVFANRDYGDIYDRLKLNDSEVKGGDKDEGCSSES